MNEPRVPVRCLLAALVVTTAAAVAQQRDRAGREPAAGPAQLPLDELEFRCVGPTRGGRVTAVAGVAQRPGTFFMGASGGGVWRTRDYGQSWDCVSDGAFASPSIGAIRAAPTDPDLVWVGTGSDGLRSNVIPGKGVYKSTDGGDSWQFMGLPRAGLIGAVEIHPHNQDVVFVAAIGDPFAPNPERGLYRTTDGGATWQHVLFVSERTGAVDVEFCPADPQVVLACTWQADRKPWTITSGGEEGGVHRSTDGGSTWQQVAGGLPDGLVGKSDLAVSPADPDRVYLLIEAPGDRGGVYRSDDRGVTWSQVSDSGSLRARPFYYTNIDCNPQDADDVFVSATSFQRSQDGGRRWQRLRTTHGDHHDLWIDPADPEVWIQGNDGGASVTRDGGRTWSTLHNQPTAELYQVHVDNRYPYWLYAGQQDNSTIRVPALPPGPSPTGDEGFWQSVGGCETGPAVPHPIDPDIVFAACKGRFGVYNARTGQEQAYDVGAANMYGHNPKDLQYRFQRVSPIAISPHDPERVYHCSQFVHVTTDRGQTWQTISPDLTAFEPDKQVVSGAPITRDITGEEIYSTIYSLKESVVQQGVIWVGANDGPVHVTTDNGRTWRDVTPRELPPGGRVQTVEPSPHQAGKAYVCVLRYQLGDPSPHVYRTEDFGQSWTRLTPGDNGVPADHPTRVVREDPAREGLLYLGTEWGMFVSFDDGQRWQPFQLGLPVTPVTDLQVHQGDLVVSTMGRSFWVLDDLSPVRQWRPELAEQVALFTPRPALRTRHRGSRGVPEYPGPGAVIDYWLPSAVAPGALRLEVLDAGGEVVQRFSGQRPRGRRREVGEADRMENVRAEPLGEPVLGTGAGHHRFVWDLRGAATELGGELRGRRGPVVVPGRYLLRLAVGEGDGDAGGVVAQTAPLEVRLDPRLVAAGVTQQDLEAQRALQLRVQRAMAAARDLRDEVQRRLRSDRGDRERLRAIARELTSERGIEYPQPMLLEQLFYLDRIVGGADQRPGDHAVARCAELEAWIERLQSQLPDGGAGR